MAYVPVPKDLTKVKTKIAFNLTKRQLICFGIAVFVGVPTYLFARNIIGNSTSVILMIGIMLPFFFLAMFEKDGLPAEKVLRNIIRAKFWPSTRIYKTENLYKDFKSKEKNDIAVQTTKTKVSNKTKKYK